MFLLDQRPLADVVFQVDIGPPAFGCSLGQPRQAHFVQAIGDGLQRRRMARVPSWLKSGSLQAGARARFPNSKTASHPSHGPPTKVPCAVT
jgi:hypothetical protein